MQNCARSFLLFALLISLSFQGVYAQQNDFQILRVDDSNWPTMRAEYIVTDIGGTSLRDIDPSEFVIRENGRQVTIISRDCPPEPAPTPLDVVLVNDRSSSMWGSFDDSDELKIQLLRRGALAFVDRMIPSLSSDVAEVAITAFAKETLLLQDFTSDELALRTAINNLDPTAPGTVGTSYTSAFDDPVNGAINLLKNRPLNRGNPPQAVKRYIIMLTDGQCREEFLDPCFEPYQLADSIRTHNIELISIAMGFTMGDSLRSLTKAVDGTVYEEITEQAEIRAMYQQIAETIQGQLPCTITWRSEVGCEDIDREVEIEYLPYGETRTFKYRPDPADAVADYTIEPSVLSFGNPEPNSPVERSLTLTIGDNDLGRYTISNILISDPPLVNNNYEVVSISVDGAAPQTLADFLADGGDLRPGAVVVIVVRFTQDDDRAFIVRNLVFESEPCDIQPVTIWGGGARNAATEVFVQAAPLNSRCEGVEIIWFATPLERRVRLSYREEGDTDWIVITEDASGGTYQWMNPPDGSNGEKYELRAEATGEFADWDWARDEGGNGVDNLEAVTVNAAGDIFAVGAFEGAFDFGEDPNLFPSDERVEHFIAQYRADGSMERAVASRGRIVGEGIFSMDAVDAAANGAGIYVIGNNIGADRNSDPKNVTESKLDKQQSIRFYETDQLQTVPNAVRGPHRRTPDFDFLQGPFIDVEVPFGGTNAFVLGNMTKSTNTIKKRGFYVLQYDQGLNQVWSLDVNPRLSTGPDVPGALANAMAVGIDESVIVVGDVKDQNTDFDGATLQPGPFVAKFDRSGDLVWAVELDKGDNVIASDVAVNAQGEIFVIGTYDGTPQFAGRTLGSIGATDVFVAKLNGDNGNVDWAARAYSQNNSSERDDAIAVAVDGNGDCYVTGAFRGRLMSLENSSGGLAFELRNAGGTGSADIFVARYTRDGDIVWANSAGGDREDIPTGGIEIDGANGIVLGGNLAIGTIGSGVGVPDFGTTTLEHVGNGDMFIAKLFSYESGEGEYGTIEIATPEPELLPNAPIEFDAVPAGASTQEFPLLINSGNWPMCIESWRLEGADADAFDVQNIPGPDDDELAPFDPDDPRDVIGLEMTFTPPVKKDAYSATLIIKTKCGEEKSFTLQGEGLDPCTHTVEELGDLGPTEPDVTAEFTINDAICNTTGDDLELTINLTGADERFFTITSPNPATVPAGGCYQLSIAFSPTDEACPVTEEVLVEYRLGSCNYTETIRGVCLIGDANILAEDFEVGPIICADDQPVTQPLRITNNGSSELVLETPTIAAGDHGFSLAPGVSFPITVPAGETVEIDIVFNPADFGPKATTITFGGNAANVTDPIPLLGAKETVTWSFSPDPVDFENLSEVEFNGVTNVIDVEITNTGSVAADLNGATLAAPFEIVDTTPLGTNLAPGESIILQVRFNKPAAEGLQEATLNLVYAPECDPAFAVVSGSFGQAAVDIILPTLEGDVRDRNFRIPITMQPADSYALLAGVESGRAFEMTVRVDARLLMVNDNDLAASDCINCTSVTELVAGVAGEAVEEWRHITVSGTAPAWNVGDGPVNVFSIGGIVMLGNAESTPIELVSYSWPGVSVDNDAPGILVLSGICQEGGVRLLQRTSNGFGIKNISPNPGRGKVLLDLATVEVGLHILEVYDVSGRVVFSRQWQELARYNDAGHVSSGSELQAELNANELPSGVYQVILRTPTTHVNESLVISR
jgi:hypothetical protein